MAKVSIYYTSSKQSFFAGKQESICHSVHMSRNLKLLLNRTNTDETLHSCSIKPEFMYVPEKG